MAEAASLGRAGGQVERAMAALGRAAGRPSAALKAAADAVWGLFIGESAASGTTGRSSSSTAFQGPVRLGRGTPTAEWNLPLC